MPHEMQLEAEEHPVNSRAHPRIGCTRRRGDKGANNEGCDAELPKGQPLLRHAAKERAIALRLWQENLQDNSKGNGYLAILQRAGAVPAPDKQND